MEATLVPGSAFAVLMGNWQSLVEVIPGVTFSVGGVPWRDAIRAHCPPTVRKLILALGADQVAQEGAVGVLADVIHEATFHCKDLEVVHLVFPVPTKEASVKFLEPLETKIFGILSGRYPVARIFLPTKAIKAMSLNFDASGRLTKSAFRRLEGLFSKFDIGIRFRQTVISVPRNFVRKPAFKHPNVKRPGHEKLLLRDFLPFVKDLPSPNDGVKLQVTNAINTNLFRHPPPPFGPYLPPPHFSHPPPFFRSFPPPRNYSHFPPLPRPSAPRLGVHARLGARPSASSSPPSAQLEHLHVRANSAGEASPLPVPRCQCHSPEGRLLQLSLP